MDDLKNKLKQAELKNGVFQNISPTSMKPDDVSYFKMLADAFRKPKNVKPSGILPSIKTDLFHLNTTKPTVVWFGHSSYLIHYNGINILVDPVFCGHASPFSFMISAFEGADVYGVEDMPEIDYLILTHNHYDHFDVKSIKLLQSKIKNCCVPKGMQQKISDLLSKDTPVFELDWMNSINPTKDIRLTATPSRHFSGRGLKRNGTLWNSYVLELFSFKIFLGGDGGYDFHFKEIGKEFDAFDLAILECGQYNTSWPLIHTTPEETIQAGLDLNTSLLLPVHWAKFALANHPWDEPIKRAKQAANAASLALTTPMIGEPIVLTENFPQSEWWT